MILQFQGVDAEDFLVMTTHEIARRSGVAVVAAALAGAMLLVGQISATEHEATVDLSDVCTNPGLSFAGADSDSIWITEDVRPESWDQNTEYDGVFRHRNGAGKFTAADGTQFRFILVDVDNGVPAQPLDCNLTVRATQS